MEQSEMAEGRVTARDQGNNRKEGKAREKQRETERYVKMSQDHETRSSRNRNLKNM